jgi:hypothetical protein
LVRISNGDVPDDNMSFVISVFCAIDSGEEFFKGDVSILDDAAPYRTGERRRDWMRLHLSDKDVEDFVRGITLAKAICFVEVRIPSAPKIGSEVRDVSDEPCGDCRSLVRGRTEQVVETQATTTCCAVRPNLFFEDCPSCGLNGGSSSLFFSEPSRCLRLNSPLPKFVNLGLREAFWSALTQRCVGSRRERSLSETDSCLSDVLGRLVMGRSRSLETFQEVFQGGLVPDALVGMGLEGRGPCAHRLGIVWRRDAMPIRVIARSVESNDIRHK